MKKILLVEDDALVARIYSLKLIQAGFDVKIASDGVEAIDRLPVFRPDLVVLDLLMPRLSGTDVLQFIRGHAQLKPTKVIVFSNAFLNNIGEKLMALGADQLLLKASVTPKQLIESIETLLSRSQPPSAEMVEQQAEVLREKEPAYESGRETAADFARRIRRDFFEQIPAISQALKQSAQEFTTEKETLHRGQKLQQLSRKVGFLTHMTGLAGCHRLAQLSSAFEALLYELQETPSSVNESSLHTVTSTANLLVEALARADQADEQCLSPTSILIVDDDAVASRALQFALSRYRLSVVSVLDPFAALEKLRQHSYDVVLLDINLPGMDGIRLCQQMRQMPRQNHTPVIFLTSYMEFEPRARAILRTGDDLIAKPVLPIELTVKVIALTLKRRMGTVVKT